MDKGEKSKNSRSVASTSAASPPLKKSEQPISVPAAEEKIDEKGSNMESTSEDNFEMDTVAAAGQTLAGANLNFYVGLKAEMLPNNGDVWYPVKIMDMDIEEREVLCHYENWASRFDEWVCVDSCRIRPVTVENNSRPKPDQEFQINQKVMATWSDNRKFPAVVKTVLPDGSYEVLFMDGFRKTLKANKLTKFTRKDQELEAKNQPKAALLAPPIGSVIPFETTPITKEERRQLKRKIIVKDLFSDHRKRHKSEGSHLVKKITDEDSRLRVVLKKKKPKTPPVGAKMEGSNQIDTSNNTAIQSSMPGESVATNMGNVEGQKRKRFKNRRHYYDYESPSITSFRKPSAENSALPKQPFCPVPTAAPAEGTLNRTPVAVPDEKLPTGWSKFRALKKCGTKFDVFLVSPEGRKCRARSEIQQIYNEKGEECPMDRFDFIISGRKRRIRKRQTSTSGNTKILKKPSEKNESSAEKILSPPVINPSVESMDCGRRIKTLLPKSKPLKPVDEAPKTPVTPLIPAMSALPTPAVATPAPPSSGDPGGTNNSAGFICPVQNCGKLFRKENLLMMHVKHYHAEYNQILGSTPNVADLAYARTVGQSLDEVSPSSFLDKINWMEKQKAAAVSKSPVQVLAPLPSPVLPPSRKRPENEVSEERVPFAEEKKIITQLPRRVPEPHQLAKVQKPESSTVELKEPFVPSPEPIMPSHPEPDVDKQSTVVAVKKHSPVPEVTSPRKRRFSKYGRNLTDIENSSNSSLKAIKKRTISTSKSSTLSDYNESSLDASESGTESMFGPKLEQLKKEEVINCTCGYKEEDGLMIQCDLCLCWQHGMCNSIDSEEEVPEKYICYICLNPYRQRLSKQYTYNQDWLKEGSFPKFSFRSRSGSELAHRESLLKRSHSVTATLVQIESVLHSLKAKINVAEKSDHPKLYLWSKPWNDDKVSKEDKITPEVKEEVKIEPDENTPSGSGNIPGPQPEAPIDPLECRLRLLDHIDNYQNQIESRLTSLEAQIAALESQDPDLANDETPDFYPQTKQTMQMVMKDLQTVRRIATLS